MYETPKISLSYTKIGLLYILNVEAVFGGESPNSKSQRQLESKAIAIIGKSSYFCTEFCGRYRFDTEDVTAVY